MRYSFILFLIAGFFMVTEGLLSITSYFSGIQYQHSYAIIAIVWFLGSAIYVRFDEK